MRDLSTLIGREWLSLRRLALSGLALMTVAIGFLFVACRPPDRYRLLADPNLLRTALLPGGALLALLFSFRSFGYEMWSGTWDGLLLLPCSRRHILAAKLGVGLTSLAAALTIPVVALRAILSVLPAQGGPVLATSELLRHSPLGRALLLGALAYLSGALAALLWRERRGAFLAPLAAPLIGLLALLDHGGTTPEIRLRMALVTLVSALWLPLLAAEMARSGRTSSPWLRATRALAGVPVALLALSIAAFVALDLWYARRDAQHEEARPPRFTEGIDASGHIVRRPGSWRPISMYNWNRMAAEARSADRRWVPDYVGRRLQLFLQKDAPVFLAYDLASGYFRGCVGRDGLRPDGCAPFDGRPRVQDDFLLTPSGVFLFEERTGSILSLHDGPVSGYTNPEVGESNGLAVQSGADLLVWGEPEPAQGDPRADASDGAPDSESPDEGSGGEGTPDDAKEPARTPADPTSPRAMCRGAAEAGDVDGVAVRDAFIALSTVDRSTGEEALVVCRDGRVSERKTLPPSAPLAEPELPPRQMLLAVLVGPLISEGTAAIGLSLGAFEEDGPRFEREAFSSARPIAWLVSLSGALVLAAILALRRGAPRSRIALAAAACALLFGPAYLLGYALLSWQRRWSLPARA